MGCGTSKKTDVVEPRRIATKPYVETNGKADFSRARTPQSETVSDKDEETSQRSNEETPSSGNDVKSGASEQDESIRSDETKDCEGSNSTQETTNQEENAVPDETKDKNEGDISTVSEDPSEKKGSDEVTDEERKDPSDAAETQEESPVKDQDESTSSDEAKDQDESTPSDELKDQDESTPSDEVRDQDESTPSDELKDQDESTPSDEVKDQDESTPSDELKDQDESTPSDEVKDQDESTPSDELKDHEEISSDEVKDQDESTPPDGGEDQTESDSSEAQLAALAVAVNHQSENDTSGEVKAGDESDSQPPPPLSPPLKTQHQLVPDVTVFAELDEYVKNTPNTAASSVQSLSTYLMSKCSNDVEKVRAFFCWLAFNIEYDTASYVSKQSTPHDAGAVLQSRKAVCQGYSEVFQELCKQANIPCLAISGLAKGYSHDPEDVYTESSKVNHSWNLVHVQGEWHPLDVTWGAGHTDKGGNFHKKFKENWFLADPDMFVLRHFPVVDGNIEESAKYQLLETPVSLETFSAGIRAESLAHQIGLRYLTHDRTVIDVTGDVTIKVKTSLLPLHALSVSLTERGTHEATKDRCNTLASVEEDGTCTMYVRPPRAATYLLDVMGQVAGQDMTKLHQLVTYVIRCKSTQSELELFPDKVGAWGLQNPTATECGLTAAPDVASAVSTEVSESASAEAAAVPSDDANPAGTEPAAVSSDATTNSASAEDAAVSSDVANPACTEPAAVSSDVTTNTASAEDAAVSNDVANPATTEPAAVSSDVTTTSSASSEDAAVSSDVKNSASAKAAAVSSDVTDSASAEDAAVSCDVANPASTEPAAVSSDVTTNSASAEDAAVSSDVTNSASAEDAAVSYDVNDSANAEQFPAFGEVNDTLGVDPAPLFSDFPFPGYKSKDGQVDVPVFFKGFVPLKAQLRHAGDMADDLGHFTFLHYGESRAVVSVRLPRSGYYMLRLFAAHPEKSGYHHVADYLLFADRDSESCNPFPQAFKLAYQEKARLLQPLVREVPSGEATLYRVWAPTLSKVNVGEKKMELTSDGVWQAELTPEEGKVDVTIFAATEKDSTSLRGMYKFACGPSHS